MKRERISQNLHFQQEKSPRDYPQKPMSNLRLQNTSKSPLRSEIPSDQHKNTRYVTPSPNSRTSIHHNNPKYSSANKVNNNLVDAARPAYVRTSYKAQHAKKLAHEHEDSLQLSSSTLEDHPNAKQNFIHGYSASLLNPKYFKSAEKLNYKEEFYCNFDEDAKTKSPLPVASSPIKKSNKPTIDEIIFRKLNSINNGHLHLNKEFDKILQRQRTHLHKLETQKIVSSQTSPTKTPQRRPSPTKYSDDEGYLKQRNYYKTASSPKRKASKKPKKDKTLPPTRDEEEKQRHLEEMKNQRVKVEQLVQQLEEENKRARAELNRVKGEDAKEEINEEASSVNIQLKKLHFQYSQELIQQSQEIQHMKELLDAKAKKQTQDDLKIWKTTETLVQEYTNYKQTMQTQMKEHVDKYSQLIDEFKSYKTQAEREFIKLTGEPSPKSVFHLENQREDPVEKPKRAHLPPPQEETIESLKEQLNDKERLFFIMKKDFESELNKANEKINSSGSHEELKAKYEEELNQQKQLYANLNQNYEALQTIAKLSATAQGISPNQEVIQKLQDEIAQLNKSLASQKIETDGLMQENQRLEELAISKNKVLEENTSLKNALDKILLDKQSDSHNQFKDLLDKLEQTTNENAKLTEEFNLLVLKGKKDLETKEEEILDLKNQIQSQQRDSYENLQNDKTTQELIQIKDDENKALAGLLKEKEEELNTLILNQQDASENAKKLQSQLEEALNQAQEKENQFKELLQAKDEELSSLSQKSQKEKVDLVEREEKATRLLTENNIIIQQLESDLKSKENECNTLTQELQRSRQMLQGNQSEQEKLNLILKEIELKDEENKQLSHEIQKLIQDKHTLETEHQQQLKNKTHEIQEILEKQQLESKSQLEEIQNLKSEIVQIKSHEEQRNSEALKKLQDKQNELDQLSEVKKSNELQFNQLLENQEKAIADLSQQISVAKQNNNKEHDELNQENSRLNEQLTEVIKANELQIAQLLESQEKVTADLNQQISVAKQNNNKESDELRSENAKLIQENTKLIEQHTEITKANELQITQLLESQEKVIADLNQQIYALKQSSNINSDLEKEKDALRVENIHLTQENAKLVEQLTEVTKTNELQITQLLESHEKVIADLNQQLSMGKLNNDKENDVLRAENAKLIQDNAKLIEQNSELTRTNELQITQLLESQEKVITDLNQQISVAKQNNNKESDELRSENARLTQENTKLTEKHIEITKANELQITQLLESQEKVIADLNQQIYALKQSSNLNTDLVEKEKDALRTENNHLTQENAKLVEQLTEVTKTNELQITQLLESQEKVIADLNQQISVLKQSSNINSDLEKEKDALRAENTRLAQENNKQIEKHNEELKLLQDKLAQGTETVDKLYQAENNNNLLQNKVKDLEKDLEVALAKTNALEKSQESYEKQLEQSNLLVSELQEKILNISQTQNTENKSQELLQQKINELNEEAKKKDAKLKKLEEFEVLKLTLEEQNNQLKLFIDEQDSETKKLQEQNSELAKQVATMQDKENQIHALQQDLLTLSNENLTLKESSASGAQDKEKEFSQMKLSYENLTKDLESSRKNENDFQEELLAAKLELANLKSNPPPVNTAAVDQLKKENEKLAKDLKEQDEIVNYYKNEFEKMVEQVSEYSNKEMKYLQQIRELKNGKK